MAFEARLSLLLQSSFFSDFFTGGVELTPNFPTLKPPNFHRRTCASSLHLCAFFLLLVCRHSLLFNIYSTYPELKQFNILATTPVIIQLRPFSFYSVLACHGLFVRNIFGKRFLTVQLLVRWKLVGFKRPQNWWADSWSLALPNKNKQINSINHTTYRWAAAQQKWFVLLVFDLQLLSPKRSLILKAKLATMIEKWLICYYDKKRNSLC